MGYNLPTAVGKDQGLFFPIRANEGEPLPVKLIDLVAGKVIWEKDLAAEASKTISATGNTAGVRFEIYARDLPGTDLVSVNLYTATNPNAKDIGVILLNRADGSLNAITTRPAASQLISTATGVLYLFTSQGNDVLINQIKPGAKLTDFAWTQRVQKDSPVILSDYPGTDRFDAGPVSFQAGNTILLGEQKNRLNPAYYTAAADVKTGELPSWLSSGEAAIYLPLPNAISVTTYRSNPAGGYLGETRAYDLAGKEIWKVTSDPGYPVALAGKYYLVAMKEEGYLNRFDPKTGQTLWKNTDVADCRTRGAVDTINELGGKLSVFCMIKGSVRSFLIDPQTGKTLSKAELSLPSELSLTTPQTIWDSGSLILSLSLTETDKVTTTLMAVAAGKTDPLWTKAYPGYVSPVGAHLVQVENGSITGLR